MTVKTRITVRGARHRQALDRILKQKVAKLEKFCSTLKQCDIVVDTLSKTSNMKRFDVKILCKLSRKKKEISVKSIRKEHLSLAVMDAFDILRKQLVQYATQTGPHQYRHVKARSDDKRDF
jgi:ribosome-associated translation inhibitor RaiA